MFWLRTRNENVPAWQGENPLVMLADANGQSLELTPAETSWAISYNEARDGWTYFVVPLSGDGNWRRSGTEICEAREIHFGFDSWGAPPVGHLAGRVAIR